MDNSELTKNFSKMSLISSGSASQSANLYSQNSECDMLPLLAFTSAKSSSQVASIGSTILNRYLDNTGKEWTGKIQFCDEDNSMVDEKMMWKMIRPDPDKINKVYIYKFELLSKTIQHNIFHAVLMVRTDDFYYTFEKNNKNIIIQRSKGKNPILENVEGQSRNKTFIQSKVLNVRGVNIRDVVKYVMDEEGKIGYNASILHNNCMGFANRLLKQMGVDYEIDGTGWIQYAKIGLTAIDAITEQNLLNDTQATKPN